VFEPLRVLFFLVDFHILVDDVDENLGGKLYIFLINV
jgi:hypothetical protein